MKITRMVTRKQAITHYRVKAVEGFVCAGICLIVLIINLLGREYSIALVCLIFGIIFGAGGYGSLRKAQDLEDGQ